MARTNLEGVMEALGEEFTLTAGQRTTRTTAPAAAPAATLPVESLLDWDPAGAFVLGGVVHRYASRTLTSLQGITHVDGPATVAGIVGTHQELAQVTDFSRTFNLLDRLRAQVMLLTATGGDLSAVARRVGVERNRVSDDAVFREIAQVLAYLPRGTIYGLELALTKFFGAGNFRIKEQFLAPAYLQDTSVALTQHGDVQNISGFTGVTPEMVGRTVELSGFNDNNNGTFPILSYISPTSFVIINAAGTTDAGGTGRISIGPVGSNNTVFVELLNTLLASSRGHAFMTVREQKMLSGASNTVVVDGAPQYVQGVTLADESHYDSFGPTLKPSALNDPDFTAPYPSWTFFGAAETEVTMADDGAHIDAVAGTCGYYRTIRCRPESEVRFGVLLHGVGTFSAFAIHSKQACLTVRNGAYDVQVGMYRDIGVGGLNVGFVDFATGGLIRTALNITATKQHHVEIRIGKPAHYTGVSTAELWIDGVWRDSEPVTSFAATALNEVRFGSELAGGPEWVVTAANSYAHTDTNYWNSGIGGIADANANTFRVLSGNVTVADIGKSIVQDGVTTAIPFTSPGKWVLTAFNGGTQRMTLQGRQHTNDGKVNPLTGALFTVRDVDAFTFPDDASAVRLVISGSARGNDGSYAVADLRDAGDPSVVLSSPPGLPAVAQQHTNALTVASPAWIGLTSAESGLDWRLDPYFAGGAGTMVLCGTGTLAGSTLTMRQVVPLNIPVGYPVLMEVTYATTRSAHLVPAIDYANDPVDAWFPFYMPQAAFGRWQGFIKDLCAAGVIPEVINL